jgi:hypothetical protein
MGSHLVYSQMNDMELLKLVKAIEERSAPTIF